MSIIGILSCCLIAMAVFIAVAPFAIAAQFSNLPDNRNGIFLFHWIHPWIALVKYDLGKRKIELRLFGWTTVISGKQKVAETRDAVDSHDGEEKEASQPSPFPVNGGETGKGPGNEGKILGPQQKTGQEFRTPQPTAAETDQQEKKTKTTSAEDFIDPDRFTWSKLKKTIAVLRQGHAGAKIYRWCMRLLRLSMRIIRFDHLRLYAKAGVEDPAETGKFYGYFAALRSALFSTRKDIDVRLEPRFLTDVLEFEGSVSLKSSIAALFTPAIVALLTFPYITVFFVWRRLKKVYTLPKKV